MARICFIIVIFLFGLQGLRASDYYLEARNYIERYKDIAISEMQRSGVPASIKLAQAIIESRNGTSYIAVHGNNHFGIKCKVDWRGATLLATDDAPNECFRKYPSVEQSYYDHSKFLKYHRLDFYDFLFELNPADYKGWAKGLKKAGYASDQSYDKTLIKIIERYSLHQFDQIALSSYGPQPLLKVPETLASNRMTAKKPVYRAPSGKRASKTGRNSISRVHQTTSSVDLVHIVKSGETIQSIAHNYSVSPQMLFKINRIPSGAQPVKGEKIFIRKNN